MGKALPFTIDPTPAKISFSRSPALIQALPRGSRLLAAPLLRAIDVKPVRATYTHRERSVDVFFDVGGTHQFGQLFTGNHDLMKVSLVMQLCHPGELFVDVGSNWGYFSALAGLCGARVQAVDCEPIAYAEWRRTMLRHGIANAMIAPYAAFDRDGETLSFYKPWYRSNAVLGDGRGSAISAKLDTLVHGATVSVLKIDAEGSDLSVLRGAERLLCEDRPAVIVETSQNQSAIFDFMRACGYKSARHIDESKGRESLAPTTKESCPPGVDVLFHS